MRTPTAVRTGICCVLISLIAYAGEDWKKKKVSEWTEEDAQSVLSNSPWAGVTSPEFGRSSSPSRVGRGGRMGGISVGIPGIGIGMPGGGRRGGGYPPDRDPREDRESGSLREVTIRWESAKPIQEAHLKAKHTDAPSVEDRYYGIVIVGIPPRMASSNGRPKAELRPEGSKAIKSADVKLLSREEGNMILFLFPRSSEITLKHQRVQFETQIGQYQIRYSFYPADMVWDGNLEL